jgi:hypothetical protein
MTHLIGPRIFSRGLTGTFRLKPRIVCQSIIMGLLRLEQIYDLNRGEVLKANSYRSTLPSGQRI